MALEFKPEAYRAETLFHVVTFEGEATFHFMCIELAAPDHTVLKVTAMHLQKNIFTCGRHGEQAGNTPGEPVTTLDCDLALEPDFTLVCLLDDFRQGFELFAHVAHKCIHCSVAFLLTFLTLLSGVNLDLRFANNFLFIIGNPVNKTRPDYTRDLAALFGFG